MLVDRKRLDKLWSKIQVNGLDECWPWTGKLTAHGRGKLRVNGKSLYAYRIVYLLTHGEIADGLEICHKCDNGACCNPTHLWIGTHQENMSDLSRKNYKVPARGSAHGRSKLSESQVIEIHNSTGTQEEIAKRFGVSRNQISHIQKYHSWKHLRSSNVG